MSTLNPNPLNQLFKETDDELAIVIDNMLKSAASHANADADADALQSPEQIEQAKTLLVDLLSAKEVRNRAAQGLQIIFRELALHADPLILNNIKAEWERNTEALVKKMQAPPDASDLRMEIPDLENMKDLEEETPISFQDIFPISDETIGHFYQCGYRLHQNANYEEAADVFFVMSSMDYRRHNVWMALGLAEKALNHWDLALTAFSIAILTNMQNPLAFLHSAACYLALGTPTDAQECLQAAAELLDRKPADETDQTKQMKDYLSALRKLANNNYKN